MDNDPFVNSFKEYVNASNIDDGSDSDSDFSVVTNCVTPSESRATPVNFNLVNQQQQKLHNHHSNDVNKQVVIFNLDEPDGTNNEEWDRADLTNILQILAAIRAPSNFDEFRRIGKYVHNRCRRIVVTFPTTIDRYEVLTAAGNFDKIPGWGRVNIQAFRSKEEKFQQQSIGNKSKPQPISSQQSFSKNPEWRKNSIKPTPSQESIANPPPIKPNPILPNHPVDPEKEALKQQLEEIQKRMEKMAEFMEKQQQMQMQAIQPELPKTSQETVEKVEEKQVSQINTDNISQVSHNVVSTPPPNAARDTSNHFNPPPTEIAFQQHQQYHLQNQATNTFPPSYFPNIIPLKPEAANLQIQPGMANLQFQTGYPNMFATPPTPPQTNVPNPYQSFGNPSNAFHGMPNLQNSNPQGFQYPNVPPNMPFTPDPMQAMMQQMMMGVMSQITNMQAQNATQNQQATPTKKEESSESETSDSSSESESEGESESNHDTCTVNKDYQNPFRTAEKHSGQKKTLNILVLGETGVGKSTWINGIANYMSYNTLDEALKASKPICLIASKFSVYETNDDRREVILEPSHDQDRGDGATNEVFSDQGQSATQEPKTYQFETSKYIVNIIDTPGIGDTRGPKQDKENTRKILNAISNYKDLHAICFLFKANEARMTQSFKYCIGELLLQLHKDAIDNIIFFFTNARGTFYKPGDTMTPLSEFLSQLQKERGLKIRLDTEKICCTDNEAFRLVCAHYNGITFTDEDFKNFAGSWKKSASETHRFLEFAARQRPHCVADTVSINKARTIILYLAKPLADVNELIESNIKVSNDRKKDLQNTANSLADLQKKSQIPQIGIQVKKLPYPKTVCAGEKCIDTVRLPNTEQLQTIYKQICHDHCYLTNVDPEKVPEPNLIGCTAMRGQQTCRVCECMWSSHMHIRFDQIKTTASVEDPNVKLAIQNNTDATVVKQKMIKDCDQRVKELKAEQQKIIQTSLKFGSFLQANAILPYNDAFEKYVEQTVEEEEKCTKVGGDRIKLDNLKKLLAEYRQEKALLDQAAQNPVKGGSRMATADEIDDMKKELFKLKHTGKTLENLFKATEDGIAKHGNHITIRYRPPAPYSPPRNNYNWGKNQKNQNSQKYQKGGKNKNNTKQEKDEKPKGQKDKKGKKHK